MASATNSAPRMWSARVVVTDDLCPAFEPALDAGAVSIGSYEVEEWAKPRAIWAVEALFAERPDAAALAARVAVAAAAAGVAEPRLVIAEVDHRDWLAETYAGFQPLRAGRFFVHGDHVRLAPPAGMFGLRLNAATAFGSGEHESTFGCLLALSHLAKDMRLGRRMAGAAALDVGTGSGILALAMAKRWKRRVLACDIDPEAVRIARFNVARNGEAARVRVLRSDGVTAPLIPRCGPYAVVTANILARPLCAMAPSVSQLLAPGGRLIMAGLLFWQEAMVLAAYRRHGIRLIRRIRIGFWSTLVVGRPAALQ